MKKYFVLMISLIISFNNIIQGQEQSKKDQIILGASYFIYNEKEEGMPPSVTFYMYNGNPIETISGDLTYLDRKLDPNAQKPQPTTYEIKYHRGFKGASGYRIYFYDKHNNLIGWQWYNRKYKAIQIYQKYIDHGGPGEFKREQIYDLYPFPPQKGSFKDIPIKFNLSIVREKEQSFYDKIKDKVSDYAAATAKFLRKLIWGKSKKRARFENRNFEYTYIVH